VTGVDRVIPDHHLAFEERLFHAVNVDGGRLVDRLALSLSSPWFGAAVGLSLAAALWAWRRERRAQSVLALAVALALSDGLGSQVLRPLLARARPAYALPPGTVRWIAEAADVGSIPSLHASNFFAMAAVASAAWPKLWPLFFGVASAVAWSRVYVGVHWPLDVLCGALWGGICAALALASARALAGRSRSPDEGVRRNAARLPRGRASK